MVSLKHWRPQEATWGFSFCHT